MPLKRDPYLRVRCQSRWRHRWRAEKRWPITVGVSPSRRRAARSFSCSSTRRSGVPLPQGHQGETAARRQWTSIRAPRGTRNRCCWRGRCFSWATVFIDNRYVRRNSHSPGVGCQHLARGPSRSRSSFSPPLRYAPSGLYFVGACARISRNAGADYRRRVASHVSRGHAQQRVGKNAHPGSRF